MSHRVPLPCSEHQTRRLPVLHVDHIKQRVGEKHVLVPRCSQVELSLLQPRGRAAAITQLSLGLLLVHELPAAYLHGAGDLDGLQLV